jgi:hypothetical protein
MPIPTVFRPVKSNDVLVRPFKAYKSYTINSNSEYSSSGYRVHNALHNIHAIHVGDSSYRYPVNSIDNTNQHVIWKSINHRYYQYPFDATRCHELTNNRVTEKYLHYSASILTLPYFDVGEQIKPGTVTVYGTPVNTQITLIDDGYGNLRDSYINTSSFASASNLMFYMSFNDEFRKFEKQFGTISTGSVKYILDKQELIAQCVNVEITEGILDSNNISSGVASKHSNKSYIKVPHHTLFNKFNKTDNWSISFWYYIDSSNITADAGVSIISKYASIDESYITKNTNVRTLKPRNLTLPAYTSNTTAWNKLRTPMHIELVSGSSTVVQFVASNGTNSTVLSGSWGGLQTWHHCAIVNNSTNVKMYIDNTLVDTDVLPVGTTSNLANLIIGNHNTVNSLSFPFKLDEIRFYNYAITESEVTSLSNNHYLSGSLYQTNMAGNVFYRNGQIVVSSLMGKYNSGSGFFNNEWTASWKGTHTIYENEVMVRIPADQFNYTMNPTATYRPASSVNSTSDIEKYNGPGELFKSMFTSSFVNPYITTVGLYNDKAQLVAIGKLAQPVQKRDDIDMNIIVRWDY